MLHIVWKSLYSFGILLQNLFGMLICMQVFRCFHQAFPEVLFGLSASEISIHKQKKQRTKHRQHADRNCPGKLKLRNIILIDQIHQADRTKYIQQSHDYCAVPSKSDKNSKQKTALYQNQKDSDHGPAEYKFEKHILWFL